MLKSVFILVSKFDWFEAWDLDFECVQGIFRDDQPVILSAYPIDLFLRYHLVIRKD